MKDISQLLQLNTCTILPQQAKLTKDGNSEFISLPPLSLNALFPDNANLEFSANYVRINGNDNEPIHYHISHVVGVIIRGNAFLLTDSGKQKVNTGDVVVVPKGVKHEFICRKGEQMDYMAFEISDMQLDFKKHF